MGDISPPSAFEGGHVDGGNHVSDQNNAVGDAPLPPNSPQNRTPVDSQVTVSDHKSVTPLHEFPRQLPKKSSVAVRNSATPSAPAKGEHSGGGGRNLVYKPFNMHQNKKGPRPGPPPPHHVPTYHHNIWTPAPVFHPGFQRVPANTYPYNVHHGHGSPPVLAPSVMSNNGFLPHMQQPVYFNNRPSYHPPPQHYYAVGPPFPVSIGAVHNIPAGPHTFRATYPEASHQGVSKLTIAELRSCLVQQIEFYFSDENLKTGDFFFMNLVDEQGWIPISCIAEFKQIQKMNVEIPFILDALQASEAIQVQGDKVRRRNQWSEWINAYASRKTPSSISDAEEKDEVKLSSSASRSNDAKKNDLNESKSDFSKEKIEVPSTKESIVDFTSLYSDNMECAKMKSDFSKDKIEVPSTKEDIVDRPLLYSDNIDCAQKKSDFSKGKNEVPSIKKYTVDHPPLYSDSMDCAQMKSDSSKGKKEVPSTEEGIVDHPPLYSENMDCARMKSDFSEDKIEAPSAKGSIVHCPPLNSDNMETQIDCSQMKSNDHGLGSQFDLIANTTKHHRKSYKQALSTDKSLRSCRNRKMNSFPLVDEKVKDELRKTVNEHPSIAGSSRTRIDDEEDSQVAEKLVILIQNCNELKPNQPKQNKDKPIDKRSDSASRTSDDCTEGISSFAPGNADTSTISESLPVFSFYLTPLGSQGLSPSESIASSKGTVDSLSTSSQPCQRPDDKLLEGSCYKYQSYKDLHENCLNERKKTGISCSEDMNTLYGFWCYFLNQLFVRSMYGEFHKFALEDYASGHDHGIKCLFRFYSDGLKEKFAEDLYKDFEQLALDLCKKGNLYGLEQYRSFHHLRKISGHSEPLKMNPELDRLIREKYHT